MAAIDACFHPISDHFAAARIAAPGYRQSRAWRHVAEIDDVVFVVERMHQCLVGHLRFAQGRKLGEKLVEAGRLEDHQAACRAAGRQIERVRHAWRNMHACARLRRHPIAVNMEIHDTVEDVKCLGVLAMQMQTKRKFALTFWRQWTEARDCTGKRRA